MCRTGQIIYRERERHAETGQNFIASAGAGTRKELRRCHPRRACHGKRHVSCRDESAKFDETRAQILLDGEPVELLRPGR